MQYFKFGEHQLSCVFKGNWQLSGGHGAITHEQAIADLFTYVEHGVNTFDVGDIYTGAEETLGAFLAAYTSRNGKAEADKLRVHTKFVPDLDALEDLTRQDIRAIIERSLKRLGQEQLNLVQFHWWDYSKGDFVQAGLYLEELRREGLIEAIGLTNFDSEHMQQLLDAGVPVQSNQVQYSLLDPRPLNGMLDLAQKNNVAVFCYGVLAGGLIGSSKPGEEPTNRSHIKYQLVINDVGTEYYEAVLRLLGTLSAKYRTSAANIAVAYALQTPGVSSVILGPRNARHIDELSELDNFKLTAEEYHQLRTMQGKLLKTNHDDIYSYERDVNGPHGQIMKYNLNGMRATAVSS
jgi:aryl-alcohol dehydrogenase-like predicted oxidoreductase